MRFEAIPRKRERDYRVVYQPTDYALESVPRPTGCDFVSLLFNDVQLEISEGGFAEYVWGVCPRQSWQPGLHVPPPSDPGEVRLLETATLTPGFSFRLSPTRLPVSYNGENQWLCLGDPAARFSSGFSTRIASGIILVGTADNIAALWIFVSSLQ